MKKYIAIVAGAALVGIALTGCVPRLPVPDRDAPAATAPETDETPVADAPDTVKLGEVWTWSDSVSVSVSPPTPFTPTEYAAGVTYPNNILFNITLTNGSDETFEPIVMSSIASGGRAGESIFDTGNEAVVIDGFPPSGSLLPGQSITWTEAYSVLDPADITYQIAPSFAYEDAFFTS